AAVARHTVSSEDDHAAGERFDRINEDENVERGGERFGYAFMCLAAAISYRNGSWTRHFPPDRKDAPKRMIEGDHPFARPAELLKEGRRGLDAPYLGAGAGTLAIDDRLKDIDDARPRMGTSELAA